MFIGSDYSRAQELLEAIQFFNQRGWSPATSTNYSVRTLDPKNYIISRSGVDKSKFTINDLIVINSNAEIQAPYNLVGVKSSAETGIHTAIYEQFPEINCVFHTHSPLATVLSMQYEKEGQIVFDGYELLKALDGIGTHQTNTVLPIVPNSQNMAEILGNMKGRWEGVYGFLISGHGLYTWGKDIPTTKRHVEAFEFLFECHMLQRKF